MKFKDYFSKHAADYARFRPRYPAAFFDAMAKIAPTRDLAWDCGTGNGQAAGGLAEYFERVIATDASPQQIANAEPHPHVEYRVAPAEASGLGDESVDLILVAQALHWFDVPRFNAEAERVLKPGGVLFASCYLFLEIEPQIDAIVNHFYHDVVGAYWPPERTIIENGYRDLPFPFPELSLPRFVMEQRWTLDHLLGYLRSWSATQNFIAARKCDPVDQIEPELLHAWGERAVERNVIWPLLVRAGRKPKSSEGADLAIHPSPASSMPSP